MSDAVQLPDAWLRGSVEGVHPYLTPAAHAFTQTAEEVRRVAAVTAPSMLWERPGSAASVGFHLRHLAGSTRRLLAYARGEQLTPEQMAAKAREGETGDGTELDELVADVMAALDEAMAQLRSTPADTLLDARHVGKGRLPTTVFGAIFHAAEHAQRHAGQLVTTVKALEGMDHGLPHAVD